MNYAETLEWLYARLPMFTRVGAAALKLDLTKTIELAAAAGNPQEKLRCIHVAGTNGKGSVSHALAAIFQAAGYKTGLYTSPHLNDFRERIKIDGQLIPEKDVITFVAKYEAAIHQINPSFFEATMIMAFEYFAAEKVDIAIIETGMGGRFDSSNIITPLLSVITNIGLDHMQFLGDSLPLIAIEKAGIIKPGIPVVIGETHVLTAPVFINIAKANNAKIVFADQIRTVSEIVSSAKGLQVSYKKTEQETAPNTTSTTYFTDLPAIYQAKNLATVLAAIDIIQQSNLYPNITSQAVSNGITTVKSSTGLMGRWEVLQESPLTVIDVAHNVDGIRQILTQLAFLPVEQLHLVFGMVHDKDINAVLQLLPPQATYYFTQAQIPRAMDAFQLAALAARHNLKGSAYATVSEAVNAARRQTAPNDLLLIFGSVFVIAEVDRSLFNTGIIPAPTHSIT